MSKVIPDPIPRDGDFYSDAVHTIAPDLSALDLKYKNYTGTRTTPTATDSTSDISGSNTKRSIPQSEQNKIKAQTIIETIRRESGGYRYRFPNGGLTIDDYLKNIIAQLLDEYDKVYSSVTVDERDEQVTRAVAAQKDHDLGRARTVLQTIATSYNDYVEAAPGVFFAVLEGVWIGLGLGDLHEMMEFKARDYAKDTF